MARAQIVEFGAVRKNLAYAEVKFYETDANGEKTSTAATLYSASTGSTERDNPQTLDENGQLSVACYAEASVIAVVTNLPASVNRQVQSLTLDPLQYPLPVTNAALAGAAGTEAAEDAAVAAAADAASSASDAADAAADAAAVLAAATGLNFLTGTSTTSLTVTGTGNKVLTTQSGKGWAQGQRLRISSDDSTKINDGTVVSYSGTTLTLNVTDVVAGTGTHADWNISVIGEKGSSGAGSGDLLSTNNLSDLTNAGTARNNLGLGSSAVENSFFVQEKTGTIATVLTTTTKIPQDDTIPQSTEGTEAVTVSITPKATTNKLLITVSIPVSFSAGGAAGVIALFKDSDTSAIAVAPFGMADNGLMYTALLQHEMDAGSTSAITFKARIGSFFTGTLTINGVSGSRKYGGILKASITVVEVKQ